MTRYFVTRHIGGHDWVHRQRLQVDEFLDELDPRQIGPHDVVMGTLPVHVASEVCRAGARYMHLRMTVPPSHRGRELTADEMTRFGAHLVELRVMPADEGGPEPTTPRCRPMALRGGRRLLLWCYLAGLIAATACITLLSMVLVRRDPSGATAGSGFGDAPIAVLAGAALIASALLVVCVGGLLRRFARC